VGMSTLRAAVGRGEREKQPGGQNHPCTGVDDERGLFRHQKKTRGINLSTSAGKKGTDDVDVLTRNRGGHGGERSSRLNRGGRR